MKRKAELLIVLIIIALVFAFYPKRSDPKVIEKSIRSIWTGEIEPRMYNIGIGSSQQAVWEKIGPEWNGSRWKSGEIEVEFALVKVPQKDFPVPAVVFATCTFLEDPSLDAKGPFAMVGDFRESIHEVFSGVEVLLIAGRPRAELYELQHPGGAGGTTLIVDYDELGRVSELSIFHPQHFLSPQKVYEMNSTLGPYGPGAELFRGPEEREMFYQLLEGLQ